MQDAKEEVQARLNIEDVIGEYAVEACGGGVLRG